MIETHTRSVLVLTDGNVVGIVTFQDVLRAVAGAHRLSRSRATSDL
ncbi:MAG: hypothetical protein JWP02_2789, partial [Acidimicrobiales bacterium]|nr:hypothetical protein [Acidimicrobiales bacterium]